MDLTNEPIAQREPTVESFQSMVQSLDVVGRLLNVTDRDARGNILLEQEQIRERGLRSLDLGGQDRFLADVGVEELSRIGQEESYAIQSPERLICVVEQILSLGVDLDKGIRRERRWVKRVVPVWSTLRLDEAPCTGTCRVRRSLAGSCRDGSAPLEVVRASKA